MSATADTRREWFERWPERRDWELAEFAALELPATERIEDGRLVVDTELVFRGEPEAIEVRYPRDFPDFPPTIVARRDLLGRHQNTTAGNLCVLEDPDNDWWPGWSAAELIDVKLRALLEDTEQGPDAVREGEADMVESISAEILYSAGDAVLVPEPFWRPDFACEHGEFALQSLVSDRQFLLTRVAGAGDVDAELMERLIPSGSQRRRGAWVHLQQALDPWPTRGEILAAAAAASPALLASANAELVRKHRQTHADAWVAMTFMEEGPRRGETRRAWVFAELRVRRFQTPEILRFVRAHALTAAARALRTPELVGLNSARVAVVGAGSLGGPLTFELAKAGVGQIDLLDDDFYEVNNSVRHVLAIHDAGLKKAIAVAIDAEQLNPFVTVTPHATNVRGFSADDVLRDADVVVDTTGSQAVARLLSRRCRAFGRILMVAGLSNGGYGGDIAILTPDGPCFMCLVLQQQSGRVPTPRSGPRSNVTPTGCGHPAFAGAGFDATALAAATARAVVGVGGWCDYPAPAYDWAVLNFRGDEPWREGQLERHPSCPVCAANVTLLIDAGARLALEREASRRRLLETGGALFGFADDDDVVVACAYGPGPRARHRRASFEPHRPTTAAVMRAVRDASDRRYRFLGSWHTHPAGRAVPSVRDTDTAADIAADPDVLLPRPIVLIQATGPRMRGARLAELAAWRWDLNAGRLVREPVEDVELDERWCPAVAFPGAQLTG